MDRTYKNALELTKIILEFFGLKTGLFSFITAFLGNDISDESNLTEKQKFIYTMTKDIRTALTDANLSEHEDVYRNLEITIRTHLDLQKILKNYGHPDGLCHALESHLYTEQEQKEDDTFPIYHAVLEQIAQAIYNHLNLFQADSHTDAAALEKLCGADAMQTLYSNILEENNFLLPYKGSLAEYLDNAALPPKNNPYKFHDLSPHMGFYGREQEIRQIDAFLNEIQPYGSYIHIWGIAGPAGIGKSKLARQIAEKHRRDMNVVWIDHTDQIQQILCIDPTQQNVYKKPVLFICDSANRMENDLLKLIHYMKGSGYTACFLLIECSENWYMHFRNHHECVHLYATYTQPLNLTNRPIAPTAAYKMLDDFSVRYYNKELSTDEKSDIFKRTENLGKNNNRCLFLLLMADLYIKKGFSGDVTKEALFHHYMGSLKERLRDCDSEALQCSGYRLLALATALNGFRMDQKYDTSPYIQQDVDCIKSGTHRNNQKLKEFLSRLCGTEVTEIQVMPLQPELMGEFLFICEFCDLTDYEERAEWMALIFSSDYGKAFLSHCLIDWYDYAGIPEMIAHMAEKYAVQTALLLMETILGIYKTEPAQKLLDAMDKIYKSNKRVVIAAYYSRALLHVSEFSEEEQCDLLLQKMLSIEADLNGDDSDGAAYVHHNAGFACYHQRQFEQAIASYQSALAIKEKRHGTEHRSTLMTYKSMGVVYECMEDYDHAIEFYSKILNFTIGILSLCNDFLLN